MDIKEKINTISAKLFDQIVEVRRHLHAHPELSQQEKKTAAYICEFLKKVGIPYKTFDKHYGILGTLEGTQPESKVVALRADMDALPIHEHNKTSYTSQNKGVMHACGHDVHTAALLGVATILNNLKKYYSGTVKLIFQPSEEMYPGGASMMINDGVLENPKVDVIIGQHVLPSIDSGKIGFRQGMAMASTDEVYITVTGKGGHAATPDLNNDPVVSASHIILALQQVVSRIAPPKTPTVLSFGRFIADGKMNIIPDKVTIEGTIRTFNEAWRKEAHEHLKRITTSVANAYNTKANVRIEKGYPALVNHPELTKRCTEAAAEIIGKDHIETLDIRMTAEDFAYYAQLIPACFYRLGVRNEEKDIISNLHTDTFDIDEKALLTAMRSMSWIAYKELIPNP